MDPALAALLGAAIGSLGSFAGMWIQQRHQTRRDRLKLAADLGLADYKENLANLKTKQQGSFRVPPVSAYVLYHAQFLDALAAGDVTPEVVQRLHSKQEELMQHYYDYKKSAGDA
jgi:hypothetical protein